MIFLFDYSTIFKPKSADYALMSFLCDLIRFGNLISLFFYSNFVLFPDLSIPDLIIIPTCLYKSYLSFSQPFLFQVKLIFLIFLILLGILGIGGIFYEKISSSRTIEGINQNGKTENCL
jgi:hypothetical protein